MEAGDKGLHAKVQQLEDEIQRLKEGERLRSELLHESAVQEIDILDQVSLGETVREMERESDRRILSSLQAEGDKSRKAESAVQELIKARQKNSHMKERDLTLMQELDSASRHLEGRILVPFAPRPEKGDLDKEIKDNPRHLARQHSWLQPLLQREAQVKQGSYQQQQAFSRGREPEGVDWM